MRQCSLQAERGYNPRYASAVHTYSVNAPLQENPMLQLSTVLAVFPEAYLPEARIQTEPGSGRKP